jgi:hypothetical protein
MEKANTRGTAGATGMVVALESRKLSIICVRNSKDSAADEVLSRLSRPFKAIGYAGGLI